MTICATYNSIMSRRGGGLERPAEMCLHLVLVTLRWRFTISIEHDNKIGNTN